jgi:DNA-binding Lrp family transcriptional regulator
MKPAPLPAVRPADDVQRALAVAVQAGLPRVAHPYAVIAERLGLEEAQVIAALQDMLARGVVRRIGVVPNHYALGYRANGMSVWDVDDAQVDALGERVGALPFVTHCYRRPRQLPLWPYNLFAMVHGRDRSEVEAQLDAIASVLGTACRARDVLYSRRILKKTGVRLAARKAANERPSPCSG